ncbi:MAG: hypothetical protein BWY09_02545 [Candidatus Hydrogenedentes bacterium ADurb.Bin179]|nr:MAG: hypothetical protein BWY09_02545 [Candidatus Hydrogenedentes bacterium ADurb.Bin179]
MLCIGLTKQGGKGKRTRGRRTGHGAAACGIGIKTGVKAGLSGKRGALKIFTTIPALSDSDFRPDET